MRPQALQSPSECSWLSLPFDARYLRWVAHPDVFMNAAEIMDWIDSVSSFLQEWHDQCLSKPENATHLKAITQDVHAFLSETLVQTDRHHYNARVQNKLVFCPAHELLLAKTSGLLDFKLYTAVTACQVARYGIRGGPFKSCEDECGWHLAAVMLLATIIADLQSGDHFATMFKKNAQAMVDATAPKTDMADMSGDRDVATLQTRLHGLSMEEGGVMKTGDAQVEAVQRGISAIRLEH